MAKRRTPWIEIACLALIGAAWLFTRYTPATPHQPRPAPTIEREEPAYPRSFSVRGIKVGMRRQEVDALFGVPSTADSFSSYPNNTGVTYGQDRVHVVMGNQLEKDGTAILREGDPLPTVLRQLGEPRNRDGYSCVYVVERSLLRVLLGPKQGYYSREPEAADQVVSSFYLKRL